MNQVAKCSTFLNDTLADAILHKVNWRGISTFVKTTSIVHNSEDREMIPVAAKIGKEERELKVLLCH